MIKGYLELNDLEKDEVYKFENRNSENKKSLEEIEKIFNNKANGYGEGSLFYFVDFKLLGKINIILEACEELGKVYINSVDILENIKDKKQVVENLINGAITVSRKHNPISIFLGANNEEILNIFEELGYKREYVSFKMSLEDRSLRGEILDLVSLNNENKYKYLEVINKSFSDMPHGAYHYISDIENYINISNENNNFFMVVKDNEIIGFLNVEIEKGKGLFDIGICKEYRGRGFGKALLETAIDFLNKKTIEKIELYVIEKNYKAYNMYKKRGFKEEEVLRHWMEIN